MTPAPNTKTLEIDVWSDIVCPWCAIGKRRLELALEAFPHKDAVKVVWHSFELDPRAPKVQEGDNAARLGQKYGRSRAEALAMMKNVEDTAAKDGLELHLTTARSGNTFDGHRVLHLAADRGVQNAVKHRLLEGYMKDGEAIGEREVVVKLAAEAGLDADETRAMLATDRYAKEVREDEQTARELGVSGVPFFVLGKKYAVSGAQPVEVLAKALERAWGDPEARAGVAQQEAQDGKDAQEGDACGPDGCA